MKIKIINKEGTFNKVYEKIKGKLVVSKNNYAIEEIIKKVLQIEICTDTINKTADFLNQHCKDKQIILTGSM